MSAKDKALRRIGYIGSFSKKTISEAKKRFKEDSKNPYPIRHSSHNYDSWENYLPGMRYHSKK